MTTVNEVHEVPRTELWPLTAAMLALWAGLLCLSVRWLDDWGCHGPGLAAALGRSQRQAISAATAIASLIMAPAKAVNAGSDLAIDSDQPTARDQRQRNHHTQATRRAQKRSPKPHLSLIFPRGARHEEQHAGAARPIKHLSGSLV